jgi:FlaA1/EpsC-like NDP-sugar epimerase
MFMGLPGQIINKTKAKNLIFLSMQTEIAGVIGLIIIYLKIMKLLQAQYIKHFFILRPSITEAVQLVLQAGAMGKGNEVFVLDMGKPIRIFDLAQEMIRLSGFEPDKDIPIVFTGKRPGEKLFEELLTAEEGTVATKHEKLFVTQGLDALGSEYMEKVENLIRRTKDNMDKEGIIALLKELVPTYQPESLKKESISNLLSTSVTSDGSKKL